MFGSLATVFGKSTWSEYFVVHQYLTIVTHNTDASGMWLPLPSSFSYLADVALDTKDK